MKVKLLKATKVITIQDAKFTIGIINRETYLNAYGLFATASQFLRMCGGKTANKNATPEEIRESLKAAAESAKALDTKKYQQALKDIRDAYREFCKYGIKAHEGIVDEEGNAVPCEKIKEGDLEVLTDATLETYEVNGLFLELGLGVWDFNSSTEAEQKN